MLKLQPNPTFKAKVSISVAGDRNQDIDVEFKYLSKTKIKTYFEDISGKSDADALAEIIVGWSGVEVAYSAEALAELIDNYPSAAADLFEVFRKELMEGKRKN
jgi:hypothetical protein